MIQLKMHTKLTRSSKYIMDVTGDRHCDTEPAYVWYGPHGEVSGFAYLQNGECHRVSGPAYVALHRPDTDPSHADKTIVSSAGEVYYIRNEAYYYQGLCVKVVEHPLRTSLHWGVRLKLWLREVVKCLFG